ncbi:hypothetical protein TNCV_224341 [Trichonephila clavipes]|nr:hypothetical protein TNCV_224341 [Trichonephila clavipes]
MTQFTCIPKYCGVFSSDIARCPTAGVVNLYGSTCHFVLQKCRTRSHNTKIEKKNIFVENSRVFSSFEFQPGCKSQCHLEEEGGLKKRAVSSSPDVEQTTLTPHLEKPNDFLGGWTGWLKVKQPTGVIYMDFNPEIIKNEYFSLLPRRRLKDSSDGVK